jgi:hypothetical protein
MVDTSLYRWRLAHSAQALQHDHCPAAHQKKLPRVAVRVTEYEAGFASTVFTCMSCSSTAYATIGHAVKIMLKLLIISVVKIGTAEKPAREKQTADTTRQQV